jgi:NADP-dependent 3-hydroxy acid dehydrogenase YdfG
VLKGKIAWVTGGGTGIGRAGAEELASAGATVILSGRRPAELEEVKKAIAAKGGTAELAPLDVTDKAAVARVSAEIVKRHGRVDILVNSAGMNVPHRFWKNLTPDSFESVVSANLQGSLNTIAAVLPGMRKRKDGLIINISSWAGRFAHLLTGPAYNAAKHGVVAMTLTLNMEECVNGIRACVICPGEVATPILKKRPIPPSEAEMSRMLQAEDLGRTIRFVAKMPPRVCLNEIVISPTWNRLWLGGEDIPVRP